MNTNEYILLISKNVPSQIYSSISEFHNILKYFQPVSCTLCVVIDDYRGGLSYEKGKTENFVYTVKITSSFRKFYGHYNDLACDHKLSLRSEIKALLKK
jgi:hypothetical protein